MNTFDNLLARVTKEKKKTNEIRNVKGEVDMMDTSQIQKIMQEYYKRLYVTKFNNLKQWTNSKSI